MTRAIFRRYENDYYQWRAGTFDREAFEGFRRSLRGDVMEISAVRTLWKLDRKYYAHELVVFVDSEIERAQQEDSTLAQRIHALRYSD